MDLSDLNEEQRRAVLAPIKNILVSAGAGSGKTLVLTNRIVNQLINEHIPISSFLIYFPNKLLFSLLASSKTILSII